MRSEKLTEAGKQEWYYADGQNPVGPFTEQEMKDFYTSGKLQDNSLVYQDGTKDWIPFRDSSLKMEDVAAETEEEAVDEEVVEPIVDAEETKTDEVETEETNSSNWYYADGQDPVGPFTEQEMKDFFTSGKFQDNLLIYQDGSKDWIPFKDSSLKMEEVASEIEEKAVDEEVVEPVDDSEDLKNNETEASDSSKWYYAKGNQPVGPNTEEEIIALYQIGRLDENSQVYQEGKDNWVTLNESDIKLPTKNVDTQNESNNQVADDWYYAENGQSVGPFSEEQMRQFLRTNKIYGETYVYKKGLPDWIPLKQSELFDGFTYAVQPEQPKPQVVAAKPNNTNRNLLIVLIILVILLGGCGVGYAIYQNNKQHEYEIAKIKEEKAQIEKEKEEEKLKKEQAEGEKEQAQQDAQQAHEDAAIAKSRSNTKIVTVPRKSSGSSSSHSDSGTPMTANYDVNVRSAPSKDATQVDYIYSGTTVNIIKTVQKGNETWGQIGDDRWGMH